MSEPTTRYLVVSLSLEEAPLSLSLKLNYLFKVGMKFELSKIMLSAFGAFKKLFYPMSNCSCW